MGEINLTKINLYTMLINLRNVCTLKKNNLAHCVFIECIFVSIQISEFYHLSDIRYRSV